MHSTCTQTKVFSSSTHTLRQEGNVDVKFANGCKWKPASVLLLDPKTWKSPCQLAALSCYELCASHARRCVPEILAGTQPNRTSAEAARTPTPQWANLQTISSCPVLLTVLSSDGKGGNTRATMRRVVAKIQV